MAKIKRNLMLSETLWIVAAVLFLILGDRWSVFFALALFSLSQATLYIVIAIEESRNA